MPMMKVKQRGVDDNGAPVPLLPETETVLHFEDNIILYLDDRMRGCGTVTVTQQNVYWISREFPRLGYSFDANFIDSVCLHKVGSPNLPGPWIYITFVKSQGIGDIWTQECQLKPKQPIDMEPLKMALTRIMAMNDAIQFPHSRLGPRTEF